MRTGDGEGCRQERRSRFKEVGKHTNGDGLRDLISGEVEELGIEAVDEMRIFWRVWAVTSRVKPSG